MQPLFRRFFKMERSEKAIVKGLSFSGVTQDSNMVRIDVKDNKIVRIRFGSGLGADTGVAYTK